MWGGAAAGTSQTATVSRPENSRRRSFTDDLKGQVGATGPLEGQAWPDPARSAFQGNPAVPRCTRLIAAIVCLLGHLLPPCGGRQAVAWQQDDPNAPSRGRIVEFPDLGPIPGANTPALGSGPGAFDAGGPQNSDVGIIGGRRRSGLLPRQGRSASRPAAMQIARGMQLPAPLPAPALPVRRLAIGTGDFDRTLADDQGPENGLTLDAAIEQMIADNIDIRALRHELTQADADILTAGLRTNPLIYLDSQFIPYGTFNSANPGGPTQYDVNITLPLDVSRKRQARTVVARMAKTALEAQFQDVVRRQIDNLNQAFVGLQAARLDMLAAQAAVRRSEALLEEEIRAARALPAADVGGRRQAVDLEREIRFALEKARIAALDATEAFEDSQETLAVLLGVPPERTRELVPRGGLRPVVPNLPPLDEMVRLAAGCRPDVRAVRLGVSRARAEVDLQRANRFDDVYLFYDPITIQDNSPFHQPSAKSWAIGLTFSMPIFNRNQGNVARAHSNVAQTRNELESAERRVASEVRLAEREYQYSKRALDRIEQVLLPQAEARLREAQEDFDSGEITSTISRSTSMRPRWSPRATGRPSSATAAACSTSTPRWGCACFPEVIRCAAGRCAVDDRQAGSSSASQRAKARSSRVCRSSSRVLSRASRSPGWR